MIPTSWSLLLRLSVAVLVSGAGTLALTPLVIRWARWFDWLDYPDANRWHETPTALMGGIALFGAVSLGLLSVLPSAEAGALLGGGALLFGLGILDDLYRVGPAVKVGGQMVGVGLLVAAGYVFGPSWPLWLSLPATVLWVVGLTNAVNLLDNMDGLAAGIVGIAALTLTAFACLVQNTTAVVLGGSLIGASLAFLGFNFKPARIFMGDCGSLFLGYMLAALGLVVQVEATGVAAGVGILVPAFAVAVPILDTTLVSVMRALAGRSIAKGGRDHASHRLVFLGLSEPTAVALLYGVGAAAGGLALTVFFADATLFYSLSGVGIVLLAAFGAHLVRATERRRPAGGDGAPQTMARPFRRLQSVLGPDWRVVVGLPGDAVLIGGAFVAACALSSGAGIEMRLAEMVPLVIAVKGIVFYAMGLYRGLWRFAGVAALLRTLGATILGGIAAYGVLALVYGSGVVAVSMFAIDAGLLALAAIGARFGFWTVCRFLSAQPLDGSSVPVGASTGPGGRRVLLYGAEEEGVLAMRALRRSAETAGSLAPVCRSDSVRVPVGFVDEDPSKQGQRVAGVPVFGPGEALGQMCREGHIDEVIVTKALSGEQRREVSRRCQEAGVDCRAFGLALESLREDAGRIPDSSKQVHGQRGTSTREQQPPQLSVAPPPESADGGDGRDATGGYSSRHP